MKRGLAPKCKNEAEGPFYPVRHQIYAGKIIRVSSTLRLELGPRELIHSHDLSYHAIP